MQQRHRKGAEQSQNIGQRDRAERVLPEERLSVDLLLAVLGG